MPNGVCFSGKRLQSYSWNIHIAPDWEKIFVLRAPKNTKPAFSCNGNLLVEVIDILYYEFRTRKKKSLSAIFNGIEKEVWSRRVGDKQTTRASNRKVTWLPRLPYMIYTFCVCRFIWSRERGMREIKNVKNSIFSNPPYPRAFFFFFTSRS